MSRPPMDSREEWTPREEECIARYLEGDPSEDDPAITALLAQRPELRDELDELREFALGLESSAAEERILRSEAAAAMPAPMGAQDRERLRELVDAALAPSSVADSPIRGAWLLVAAIVLVSVAFAIGSPSRGGSESDPTPPKDDRVLEDDGAWSDESVLAPRPGDGIERFAWRPEPLAAVYHVEFLGGAQPLDVEVEAAEFRPTADQQQVIRTHGSWVVRVERRSGGRKEIVRARLPAR